MPSALSANRQSFSNAPSKVFWESTIKDPGGRDPALSVPPEWRMFEDLIDSLLAGYEPSKGDPFPEWLTLQAGGQCLSTASLGHLGDDPRRLSCAMYRDARPPRIETAMAGLS